MFVDLPDETTSFALIDPTKAFIEFVLAISSQLAFSSTTRRRAPAVAV
jgi:hypothetical protein